MAKSSRSSALKKNNRVLKKKVFGPVETARNERQSAKLLELAQQAKPLRAEMEVEKSDPKDDTASAKDPKTAEDTDAAMDVDDPKGEARVTPRSNRLLEKQRHAKGKKIEKRHRKAVNNISFKKHPLKPGNKERKR